MRPAMWTLKEKRDKEANLPEGGGHTRHGQRDQVVEVAVRGGGQLQGPATQQH
jgi:hypothetical protein